MEKESFKILGEDPEFEFTQESINEIYNNLENKTIYQFSVALLKAAGFVDNNIQKD